MPKKPSEFKKIIDESSSLITKLKEYEERIKELNRSVLFLKEKSTIAKIKQQLDNKDAIIKELAEAKLQLSHELRDKNKIINHLRGQLKNLDSELDKKDSQIFLLNKQLEKQVQVLNTNGIQIKKLNNLIQALKRDLTINTNLLNKLKQELSNKNTSLTSLNQELAKKAQQLAEFNAETSALKNATKEKNKEIIALKERFNILDSTNKELAIKNSQLRDEILLLNQKIAEQNNAVQEIIKELEEKDTYYPVLIELGKEGYKKKLNQTLKQSTRTELELKARMKEMEFQLRRQKEQLLAKSQKERAIIEDLKTRISELGEFEEKKTKKRK